MRNSPSSSAPTPRMTRFLSESAPTDWLKNWEDYEYFPGCENGVDLLSWFVNAIESEQLYDTFLGNDGSLPKKMEELLAFLEGLNNPALLPLIKIVENTIKLCSEYDWGADPWLAKRVGGGSQDVNPPEFPNQQKADEQLWDVAVKPWTKELLHQVSDVVYQSCVKGEISTEPEDQFRSDAEADADVFRSIGWGSDEDYGAGDERIDSQQHTKELVMDSKIDERIARIRGLVTEAERLTKRRSLREDDDIPPLDVSPAGDSAEIEPVGSEAPEGDEGESDLTQVLGLVGDITEKVKKNLTAYADEKVITPEEMEEFTEIIDELNEVLDGMKDSGADDGAVKEVLKVLADLLDRYISITSVSDKKESIENPSQKPPEEKADTPKPDEKEVDPEKQIIKTPSDKPQEPTLPPDPSGSKA